MNEKKPITAYGETFVHCGTGYGLDLKSLSVEIIEPKGGATPWLLSVGDNQHVLQTKALQFATLEDALEAGSVFGKAIRAVNELQLKSMERGG